VNDTALIYCDIETMPAHRHDLKRRIIDGAASEAAAEAESVTAPGNYKDAEKIAAYISERKAQIMAGAQGKAEAEYAKTSLDGAFGEVYCIGYAINDADPALAPRGKAVCASSEAGLIRVFFDAITELTKGRARKLVGHNFIDFDLRFIWHRAMVLGVQPPAWFPRDVKPWGDEVIDTMVMWAGSRDRVKLSKLCLAFGIEDDDEIDGSQVWDCLKRGEHAKVDLHCVKDIYKLRAVHKRMSFN